MGRLACVGTVSVRARRANRDSVNSPTGPHDKSTYYASSGPNNCDRVLLRSMGLDLSQAEELSAGGVAGRAAFWGVEAMAPFSGRSLLRFRLGFCLKCGLGLPSA